MTSTPEVHIADLADQLTAGVVDRLVATLGAALGGRDRAGLALTAGGIMEQVWTALAASPAAAELDWSRVDVFWGDERFVPSDSSDRNDAPAERILFSVAPFSHATRYSMPASGGQYGEDLDAAAAGYSQTLAEAERAAGAAADGADGGAMPTIDVVLLGIGPDGHCCSLFPGHPGLRDESAATIPIRNSPKPPPLRMSLSFDALNSAEQIWVVASGTGKADAVRRALAPGADREQVPSAGARGRQSTLWLLDRDAAATIGS